MKKERTIESKEDLFNFINGFTSLSDQYIFRGQSNTSKKEWKLESSLRRMLKGNTEIEVNEDILLKTTMDMILYFGKRATLKAEPIMILSELQHHSGKTALIDFTTDLNHALWFAFTDEKPFIDLDFGYVTIFYKKVNESDFIYDLKLEEVENENRIIVCPKTITRGISQKSYFIIDNNPNIEAEFTRVRISKKLSDDVETYLFSKRINGENIYPDNGGLVIDFLNNDPFSLIMQSESYLYNLWESKDEILVEASLQRAKAVAERLNKLQEKYKIPQHVPLSNLNGRIRHYDMKRLIIEVLNSKNNGDIDNDGNNVQELNESKKEHIIKLFEEAKMNFDTQIEISKRSNELLVIHTGPKSYLDKIDLYFEYLQFLNESDGVDPELINTLLSEIRETLLSLWKKIILFGDEFKHRYISRLQEYLDKYGEYKNE